MPKYWCVNFEDDANLELGIEKNLWLMGYQYSKRDTPHRKGDITRNWRKLKEINAGDRFVAYLRGKGFFAIGTVILPRRARTSRDRTDSIDEYLNRGKSYSKGYVYFSSSVVYENFTDAGADYPVRIDVEQWDNYASNGVSVTGLNLPRHKTVNAVFPITKAEFDRIESKLASEGRSLPKSSVISDGAASSALSKTAAEINESGYFNLAALTDERQKSLREIVERRGQPEFRNRLIAAYGGRCAVTGCDALAALEAAHIVPYTGPQSHHVTNGLLLRADIHTLFDIDLIGINPVSLTISVAAAIKATVYAELHGRKLSLPDKTVDAPNREALKERWKRFGGQAES
jgi:predicted restriction endonuclease